MTNASGNVPTEVPYRDHVGATRQYMRDIILGVNDGLVSIFLLVVGVVGGGFASREILLAAVAAAVAGAISMAAGEYVATKSQEEVFDGERELEREHLKHHRDVERDEIREMFGEMGLESRLVEEIVDSLDRDDEAFLKVMMALEFGVVEEERRSPILAAVFSGLLFLAGSLPSVLPFVFIATPSTGLAVAAVASGIALFAVGALKTVTTKTHPIISGLENMAIAAGGAVLSFAIGRIYDTYA